MGTSLPQKDAHQKGTLLYKMGRAYAALQRYARRQVPWANHIQVLEGAAAGTLMEKVTILAELETAYKARGQEDKAAEVNGRIEALLTEVATSTNMSNLDDLANYYMSRDRLSDAENVLEHIHNGIGQDQMSERDAHEVGLSYIRLGRAYEKESVRDKALVSYQLAAGLIEARVDPHLHGLIMHDIGDVYRAEWQFEEALNYYEKAREYKEHDVVSTLHAIGDAHTELAQHENAITAYREAVEKLETGPK